MAEESFQEKTERATPKKKREAREKGNIPRSNEVNSAVILLVSGFGFVFFGKHMATGIQTFVKTIFKDFSAIELSISNFPQLAQDAGLAFAVIMGPFLLTIMVAGITANVMQSGITFSSQSIEPKLEKIDPIAGFKRLFSLRSFVELIKNVIKMAVILIIGYHTIKGEWREFFDLANQDVAQIIAFIGSLALKLIFRVAVIFAVVAALDYMYQRYEYEKNLRMTKQEVKEEMKQSEGDPLVKSRIRTIQREQARRRMMNLVPTADVVITNPTHYAIALKFESDSMAAPIVVAKGIRKMALRIREIAKEHNVPIIEKPVVARLLYQSAEVGQEIPVELYQVVAEILAQVYQLKKSA